MSDYEFSLYNGISVNTRGENVLFNTHSNKCCIISESLKRSIDEYRAENKCFPEGSRYFSAFSDMGFIVSSTESEFETIQYNYIQKAFLSKTLNLTIMITDACNFRCVYCWQNHGTQIMTTIAKNKIYKFIDYMTKVNCDKVFITWFGGEPLINKTIVAEMASEIKQITKKNNTAFISHIITNGYELTYDLFRRLVANNVHSFTITLDGPAEVHNAQRPHANGGPTFETILNNLVQIKEQSNNLRFKIQIRVNVSPDTQNGFFQLATMYQRIFGSDKRFELIPEPIRAWTGDDELTVDDSKTDYGFAYRLKEQLASININTENLLNLENVFQTCPASQKYGFVVDWNANLYKCDIGLFEKNTGVRNCLGYIDENGVPTIDKSKEAFWIIQNTSKHNCKECLLFPKCLGVKCIHRIKLDDHSKCKFFNTLVEGVVASANAMSLSPNAIHIE